MIQAKRYSLRYTPMCVVFTGEIFSVKSLKSYSFTKLDVLALRISTSFVASCHRKQSQFPLKPI